MSYVPDAYDMWEKHEHEREKTLLRFPVCDACGERIQDDHCYKIGHEVLCEECMKENFRIETNSLIDEV